ncbi:MAG TPA: lamin tail domain-containing protein [Bryobacteraceae bacterium]|nr:lamin tail domain-containing protein [Bryobacteraceae bacterium]
MVLILPVDNGGVKHLSITLVLACSALAQTDVVISQVFGGGGNTGAPLRNDFVELFNRSRSTVNLAGWSVQYGSATQADWEVAPISGTIQPGGYFLVQLAQGANAAAPALPTPDAAGALMLSSTNGKIALARTTQPLNGIRPADVVDLVGYGTANGFEGTAAARSLSNSTALLRRGAGCIDTNDNAADFSVGEPRPRNSGTTPAVDCNAPPPAPTSLRISEVQGPGDESPVAGQLVSVRGIITGKRRDGFWIQTLPGEEDTSDATSEGLWVYFAMTPPGTTGNVVRVTGTVAEFRPAADRTSPPLTELIEPQFEVISATGPLPAPVTLESLRNLERLEGMLVSVPQLTAVSGTLGALEESTSTSTSNGVFFGVLPGSPRPFRTAGNHRPELLRVDTRAQGGPALNVSSGATVSNLLGPLDFAFRTYTVAQDPLLTAISAGGRTPEPARFPNAREFVVASMNLQRLFDTRDDPGTSDPVLTPAAVENKVAKIAATIRTLLHSPDIIGVQEAENAEVLRAVARAAGEYDEYLREGNDIGGIDVGLLVKRGRVQVVDITQEGTELMSGSGRLWDRPPLVARLRVEGAPITAIVVHLRSLIDAEDPVVAAKRRGQAEFLRALVARRTSAGEEVFVLGDFNNYQFDELMTLIRSGGDLTNLTDILPPGENYSYVHDGVTQTLDHILVGPGARSRVTAAQFVRVNADYADIRRNEPARPERYADHDVPLGYFSLSPETLQVVAAGITNAATFLSGPVAPLEIITIFGRAFAADSRVLFDGQFAEMVYAAAGQVSAVVPAQLQFRGATAVQVETAGVRTPAVEVPVVPAVPGIFVIAREGGRNQGAVLNQDSSVNGPGNPAPRGSVVQIFATGGGMPGTSSGAMQLAAPAAVLINGRRAEVQYAGPAPGLITGALQVNVRVPEDIGAGDAELVIAVGGRPSAPVTIAVR